MNSKGLGILGVLAFGLATMAPAQDADTQPAPAGAPDTAALQTGPATITPHWSKYDYPREIPEGASYYIVVRGDTLWDISSRFMGSPFLWPQIWDANRYITDAHWIYPGDPLVMPRVQVVTDGAGMAPEPVIEDDAPAAVSAPARALIPAIEEQALQCAHYTVDQREDESLYVIGNEQGAAKIAYADRDILYLSKGSNSGVKPGDVYTIQHATYDVRHPDTNRVIGKKIETTGWLRVLLVSENSATAIVEQACRDIHDGDYLKPFARVSVPLVAAHTPPDRLDIPTGDINGAVIDMGEDTMIGGEGNLVTINLGTEHGVAPGNIFSIYRIMFPTIPTSRRAIGEAIVVSTQRRTAVARVSYSADAIISGDRVERR